MSGTILVVDDDDSIRALLTTFLEEEGYVVRSAVDGAEALRLVLNDVRPDLLLLDIGLPIVNGIEFVKLYRARAEPPYAPIIIISARGDAEEIAAELDCDGYVNKPFSLEEVAAEIAGAVAKNGSPPRERIYTNPDHLRAGTGQSMGPRLYTEITNAAPHASPGT